MKRYRVPLVISLAGAIVILAALLRVSSAAADATWRGEYYNNPWLVGAPVLVRNDAAPSFDWGYGSPAPEIPVDNFSVRWTNMVDLPGGTVRFTAWADDGVRLFVDGTLVIDSWHDSPYAARQGDISVAAGPHAIRLEYYEHFGTAAVQLAWQTVQVANGGNIITCVRPHDSWIKVYRLENGQWQDLNPHGWGPVDATGFLKIDGMPVDPWAYGSSGQPYRVELWASGALIRSVGDTDRGEPEFRVYPGADSVTPWGCPAP